MDGQNIGPYKVIERIGAGGMGEVYRARDKRLHRDVAIKRLPEHAATDPVRRRNLLREARSAARISHQNVAVLHDVIEDGEQLYLVMELVQGQTLRKRLGRAITLDAILDIAVQCCRGLAAAHREGVVHGDIKPDNIMVSADGNVKILDFGVASMTEAINEDTATQTELASGAGGPSGGTVPFMAPEVLLGNEFDHRADIFSLGVTFYSMLTGAHPFAANTGAGTIDRILHQQPVPAVQLNPLVPAHLLPVLEKMLAKAPEDRYATVDDLLVDLQAVRTSVTSPEVSAPLSAPVSVPTPVSAQVPAAAPPAQSSLWWLGLGAVVVAAVALLALWQFRPPAGGAAPAVPARFDATDWVIAVLPAAGGDEDAEVSALKDGLAATLTSKLTQMSRAHGLQVIPMSSIRARGVEEFGEARKELGVTLVIDFHLRRVGDDLRVNVNLIDTAAERQLDAATVDGSTADPIDLEEQVALRALRMLRLELLPMELGLLQAGTDEPRAHGYYLRATGYLQEYSEPESIDAAVDLLEQSLRVDPDYAQAHASLGEALWNRYRLTDATVWVDRAAEECRVAIELAPDEGAGYRCLGTVYNGTGRAAEAAVELEHAKRLDPTDDATYIALGSAYQNEGRLDLAEATFEEAVALRSHYWGGYSWLGFFYFRQGRMEEAPDSYRGYSNLGVAYYAAEDWTQARRAFERALELNPEFTAAISNIGTLHFFEGNYADSAVMFERALELAEGDYSKWGNLADAYYWAEGRRDESGDAYRRALELADEKLAVNPNDAEVNANVAWYHAVLGAEESAAAHLDRALEQSATDSEILLSAAQIHEILGERERALDYLRQAVEAGYQRSAIEADPVFAELRRDSRYADIMSN